MSQSRIYQASPVQSPCVGFCQLDAQQICVGCHRSRQEIAGWTRLTPSEQRTVVVAARQRKSACGAQPQESKRGLTLVELLVVLAIIGILLSLLLPAVQAAREAARKVACKNNLHQVGLALHGYHNTHRSLPTGCIEWRGWGDPPTHRQFAWSAFLLPFLEQQPLHDRVDFSIPFDDPRNAETAGTRLQVFECPSVPETQQPRGRTDYGGLYGERIVDRDPEDGLFLYEHSIAFRDVRDGLSQTMAVAEDVGGPDSEWINGRNVFVQAHGINDSQAWIGDNEIRSQHTGGAMVLFADGHTKFMTESIAQQVLGSLITRDNGELIPNENL